MIYLDYAATSFKKPKSVYRAMFSAMRDYGANPGRGGHRLAVKAAMEVYAAREQLAAMFGALPENVVFTKNATEALNIAIKGAATENSKIVISGMEHNSVYRAVASLSKKGITHSVAQVFPDDGNRTIKSFEKEITEKTSVVVCTAASNVCGLLMPIDKIGAMCRKRKITFIVDAAQTAGVFPLWMPKVKANIVCFAGHKGLYGPQGSGALISDGTTAFQTLMEGGSGSDSLLAEMPSKLPERLEYGTLNVPAIAGLKEGARFVACHRSELFEKEHRLKKMLAEGLLDLGAVLPYYEDVSAPVVSFNFSGRDCEAAADYYDMHGIALRAGWHCAPLAHRTLKTIDTGTVRASLGAFTSKDDIRKFLKASEDYIKH